MSELPYPKYDKSEKVNCQICGKSYQSITHLHLKTHNVTVIQYRSRFPNAPMVSPSFIAKHKFNKTSIFKKDNEDNIAKLIEENLSENDMLEEDVLEEIIKPSNEDFDKEVFVFEEPEIEDITPFEEKFSGEILKRSKINPMENSKARILMHLGNHFCNIKENYTVFIKNIQGMLLHEYITDFADPVLKVVVQCPNTFWHNNDRMFDPNKETRLKEYGWKVISIKSKLPSKENIDEAINNS